MTDKQKIMKNEVCACFWLVTLAISTGAFAAPNQSQLRTPRQRKHDMHISKEVSVSGRMQHSKASPGCSEQPNEGELCDLPKSFGPWNKKWENSIAICAVMRDENVTDVREWLQYHRCGNVFLLFAFTSQETGKCTLFPPCFECIACCFKIRVY